MADRGDAPGCVARGCTADAPTYAAGTAPVPTWTLGDVFTYEVRQRDGSYTDGHRGWDDRHDSTANLTFVRDRPLPTLVGDELAARATALVEGPLFPRLLEGLVYLEPTEGHRIPAAPEWVVSCEPECAAHLATGPLSYFDALPELRFPASQGDTWEAFEDAHGLPFRTNVEVVGFHDVATGAGEVRALRFVATGVFDAERGAAFLEGARPDAGADEGSFEVDVDVAYKAVIDHAPDLGVIVQSDVRAEFLYIERWTEGGHGMESSNHLAFEHEALLSGHVPGDGQACDDEAIAGRLGLDKPDPGPANAAGGGGRVVVEATGNASMAGADAVRRYEVRQANGAPLPDTATVTWSVTPSFNGSTTAGPVFEHAFLHPGTYTVTADVDLDGEDWDVFRDHLEVGWSDEVTGDCGIATLGDTCPRLDLPAGPAGYTVHVRAEAPEDLIEDNELHVRGEDGNTRIRDTDEDGELSVVVDYVAHQGALHAVVDPARSGTEATIRAEVVFEAG